MIRYEHTEIQLQGLAESATPIARPMGKLDIAENIEIRDTEGALAFCKTRGYRFIPMDDTVARADEQFEIDTLFTKVVNFNGRLLVFSYDYLTELGDRAGGIRTTDTVIYRGPCNRGNVKMRIVAVSRSSSNVPA
jgi:hypothetical protein